MNIENIIAVSGLSGLYKAVTSRGNGIIIEEFDTKKRTFVTARQHQFTPLETISIYTYDESIGLKDVFSSMFEHRNDLPALGTKGEPSEIKNYIRKAIPNYDEDRVSLSDMKKLIKWYQFLVQKNIITEANYKLVDSKNEKSEKPKSIAKSNEEE